MKKNFTLLLLPFYATSILAQNININQGKIKQKNYFQEIPYQKIRGLPIVSVTINGKMYDFLFDTGAGLSISNNLCKELNLPIRGQAFVKGSSGEGKPMRYILLPELHLQEITFSNTWGVVFHEESNFFECLGIYGIMLS